MKKAGMIVAVEMNAVDKKYGAPYLCGERCGAL